MNFKKKILAIIPVLLFITLIVGLQTTVNAGTAETRYFGISVIRTRTQEGLGYAIGNPVTGGASGNAAMLWNIREYEGLSASNPKSKQDSIYCLRAGFGFPDAPPKDIEQYNMKYDMLKERNDIANLGSGTDKSIYTNLVNGEHYNDILALLDMVYIPNETTAAQKKALLEAAKIYDDQWDYALSDDDIEAAQQAAIWYFTNSDKPSLYDKTSDDDEAWLFYTQDDSGTGTFTAFTGYKPGPRDEDGEGSQRNEQVILLYKYLIKQAKANANNYSSPDAEVSTTMTLWTSTNIENEQPLVELHKKPEEEKVFDLALRKYITAVNGTPVESREEGDQKKREPVIDESKLISGPDTTATYNHRKNPVEVKTGDEVTYNITVYNEGEVAGRATKITDQLPTGLEFLSVEEGDYVQDSYDKGTNRLVLRKVGTSNIPAYDKVDDPESETVKIKCRVVAVPSSEKDKVLTNVAWISEDANEDGTVTDRDSQPSTTPQVNKDSMENYKGLEDNDAVEPGKDDYFWKGQQDDDDFEKLVIKQGENEVFDLALRKYITAINDTLVENIEGEEKREPSIETGDLEAGNNTTATYNHRKNPVQVQVGDEVTYKITIYNEGNIAGRATKVTDQLPTGLKFVEGSITGDYTKLSYDETSNKIVFQKSSEENLDAYTNGTPDNETIQFKCEVTEAAATTTENKVLTNVAWISEDANENGEVTDRDSEPTTAPQVTPNGLVNSDPDDYKGKGTNGSVLPGRNEYWEGQQDDDDFEKLIVPGEKTLPFDLKLIKRITEINGEEQEERIESVDTSKLNTEEEDAKTTADYKLNKDPIKVSQGDIVKYTFRIYNEGYVDGYASRITEDIPEGLEFLWSEKSSTEDLEAEGYTEAEISAIQANQDLGWTYDEGSRLKTISTDYLSKDKETPPGSGNNLIKAFGANPEGTKEFTEDNYKEVSVFFRVTKDAPKGEVIRNEAAITEDSDKDDKPVGDRDSHTDDWRKYPDEEEDDEDIDNVILGGFDLALRKFISGVNDKEITDREPVVDTSKLNTTDEKGKMITTAEYKHTKEPVLVTIGDEVIYTLRVYNEGDEDGYAAEIKDHLPEYLEFIDNDFNKERGWTVSEDGKTVTTDYLKGELIKKPEEGTDGKLVLSYKDVQIMCKVKNTVQSNYKITNIADITKYEDENHESVTDRDSEEDNVDPQTEENKPSYKDDETGEYIPGQEDDDDFEKVIVKIFDLALRKWVSEVIVTEDGATYNTPTGHQPYDDPEQTVKVDLNRKKLNSTVVKFKYGIRVVNEGEIAGYAKEVKDHIPEGLEMKTEDNPLWEYLGDNTAVTNQLQDRLLQPGEYADIEIVLTWINNENDLGLKVNTAEISKDENEYGIPDVDSIPDNNTPGEDDIDDAPVILSITTGRMPLYIGLGATVLVMLAGGIFLIKKYVI